MIGVFDSGYGGLTILRALINQLPQYSYCYFADNAHAPYGEKSPDEIIKLTQSGVEFLFNKGAHIVILGCNTASAAALRYLQQKWLPQHDGEKRILGIVVPTVEQITGADWRHTTPITTPISTDKVTIGVLATPATVATKAYPTEIHKRNASLRVVQQACPGLVEAIEQQGSDITQQVIEKYVGRLLQQAPDVRAVLLGCTHYELIADSIQRLLPSSVTLYHQPTIAAKSLQTYLEKHPELAARLNVTASRQFFTTGDPTQISSATARYFGESVRFEQAG